MATLIFPTEDVVHQFAQGATQKNVRFLKLVINNEQIVVAESHPPTASVVNDYNKILTYFKDFEACYVLFHFDLEEPSSWALIRFVNERAKVREKMLYSSSTENVYTGLGKMNFSYSLFGVERDQMTLNVFVEQNITALSPALKETLSSYVNAYTSSSVADEKEREQARREKIDHVGALTREEQQIRDEARLETVVSGSTSIAFPVDPGCNVVFTQFLNNQVNFVELSIVNEQLTVSRSLTIRPSQISTSIDKALPHFYLLTFLAGSGFATLFVYSCPTGCAVRPRMSYSMGKGSTMEIIKNAGINITKTIESQEADRDLTVAQITDILSTVVVGPNLASSPPPSSSPNGQFIEVKNTRPIAGRPSQRAFTRTTGTATASAASTLLSGLKPAVKVNI